MHHQQANSHSYYRISSIEYTNDGYCMVGVRIADMDGIQQFKLSLHCHRLSWLRNFQQPDLGTIWQLAKQQSSVSFTTRVRAFFAVKSLIFMEMLNNWEEEAKRYLPGAHQDFDDW